MALIDGVAAQLAGDFINQAVALGNHVVLMDRFEILLAREDECFWAKLATKGIYDSGNHLANAVLDKSWIAVGFLYDLNLV